MNLIEVIDVIETKIRKLKEEKAKAIEEVELKYDKQIEELKSACDGTGRIFTPKIKDVL